MDLKERRKELNLTLEDVGNFVGVGKSTVRKWENGDIANMKRDKIVSLAKILKIDPLDIIDPARELTDDSNSYIKDVVSNMHKLSINRQQKVKIYTDNQLKEQLSSKNKIHSINENSYTINVLGAVSAGTGEWLTDEQHEEITVNNEPPMHDFALRVNGDSMIPLFSDGQIIYVNKIDDLDMVRNEQIVIAELNGDAFVKKIVFDNNRKSCKLISLNKEYKPIDVTSDDEFKISGVVVI